MQKLSAVEAVAIRDSARRVIAQVERVIVGKRDLIELVTVALLARGHVLIEDIPGVGKTTLAKAMAKAIGGSFKRIQFTPDLLPGDVTGLTIYNQKTNEFVFNAGPVFANVVLADEINRATPKTQSALLESMEEMQATVDGVTRVLPTPFFVIATQNPVEYRGTYPLPEAQMDRFLMRVSMGYPRHDEEIEMLERHAALDLASESTSPGLHLNGTVPPSHNGSTHTTSVVGGSVTDRVLDSETPEDNANVDMALLERVETVLTPEEAQALQTERMRVWVSPPVREYIVTLAHATRDQFEVRLGVSPRGSLALQRAAQAVAAIEGREYVLPDDVKRLAIPVLAHRMVMQTGDGPDGAAEILQRLLDEVPVPAASA
jgi:MoxR-like ATPase